MAAGRVGARSEAPGRPTLVPKFDPANLARTEGVPTAFPPPARGAIDVSAEFSLRPPKPVSDRRLTAGAPLDLRDEYLARIGSMEAVLILKVSLAELRTMPLDHRAGFVLSLIDGVSSIEMILDVCGMPEVDALRMLSELLDQGIVELT